MSKTKIIECGLPKRLVNACLASGIEHIEMLDEILNSGKPLRGVGDHFLQEYARYRLDHDGNGMIRLPWMERYARCFVYPEAESVGSLEQAGYRQMTDPYSRDAFWMLEYVLADMRRGRIPYKIGVEVMVHVPGECNYSRRDAYSVWRKAGAAISDEENNTNEGENDEQ